MSEPTEVLAQYYEKGHRAGEAGANKRMRSANTLLRHKVSTLTAELKATQSADTVPVSRKLIQRVIAHIPAGWDITQELHDLLKLEQDK